MSGRGDEAMSGYDDQNRAPLRRSGRWTEIVRRYGWRAYALPILVVVTVVALVRTTPPAHHAAARHSALATGAGPGASNATAPATPASASGATTASGGVQVEGLTGGDAAFSAGSTTAPVVISLGNDATSCATNTYNQLVLVSISKQHLWACSGRKQVNSTAVTTGATVDNDQTPLGSWRVQAKQRDRYLVGQGYRDYVQYWVPFNGDFGLHDASWQTMPFGSQGYRQHGSHGCVHLPTATMAWLYKWVTVGSTVVTITS